MFTPAFYIGVCEDRFDPLMLGRIRVRIIGLHTHDKALLPTEDLPWAYRVQSTNSAGISGIGHAPVGIVEGTSVIVQFVDGDLQQPFVVGVLGGIPNKNQSVLETYEITGGSGSAQMGQTPAPPAPTAPPPPPPTPEQVQNSFPARSASEFTTSPALIEYLKQKEGFRANPYQDQAGVWTIGYGTTFIGNVPVGPLTSPVTKDIAIGYVVEKLKKDFEPGVKSAIRAPITQSMFDACVDLAYNIGVGAFKRSQVVSNTNTGQYEAAAEAFLLFNKIRNPKTGQLEVSAGLNSRREYERNLYLKEGIPTNTGDLKETPQSIAAQAEQAQAQGTQQTESQEAGITRGKFTGDAGFSDPNNKYPLESHLDEPDTNRLARNQKIRQTAVYIKELAEHKNVAKANGKGTWNQSPTPYNAKYPFNNVWQSESGHLMEFDDTPNNERIHLYHKTGTFNEIDHNGTQVNRVVGDAYTIYERNGFVHIVGNVDVTVDGAKTLRVENTVDVEVHGATTINLYNNAKLNVGGNFEVSVGGNMNISVDGNYSVDALRIDMNSGVGAGITTVETKTPEDVGLNQLSVNTRKNEAATKYETPDDGTPQEVAQYKNERVANATATAQELSTPPPVVETKKVEENKVQPKINACGVFEGQTDFNYTAKISKYFTLNDLTDSGRRKVRNNVGLRADQIYCNLKALAENVLDVVKEKYPNMRINSCLRLENTKSQHNAGEAVDISFPGLSRADLYTRALELQQLVAHDQMLLEYANPGGNGWIHISFKKTGNRKQVFTMVNHARVGQIGTFTKVT